MCLQYIDIKQKKLKQFYHNPRVGGSSPSSATIVFHKAGRDLYEPIHFMDN